MTIHAYAATQKKAALKPFEYEPKPLGEHDVEIRITHCGICHSRFVFRVPAALASDAAAPLLCGGATVYSPLRRWVRSPMSVA
jgi:D-arabinose 1-dehydrogenase-like Zn-dependent alcohol dehydrogenase